MESLEARDKRLGAHESADAGPMRSADTCPNSLLEPETAMRVQDVMTEGREEYRADEQPRRTPGM